MTIKLNENSYTVFSYNKTTEFNGTTIRSEGYCSIRTADIDSLNELAAEGITTIQIIDNSDNVIYNATELTCSITSMEEYLNDTQIDINLRFRFS